MAFDRVLAVCEVLILTDASPSTRSFLENRSFTVWLI
jgi:hypothetical protein